MKVLLSIKPEFVEKIFNGTKKYEFRKSIFKNKNIDTVVVYASSPWQYVIGEFKIETRGYQEVVVEVDGKLAGLVRLPKLVIHLDHLADHVIIAGESEGNGLQRI